MEYTPRKTFEKFRKSMADACRLGDVDSSKKLLADTDKLIGNSCYGKTITNKDKHRDVRYVDGHKAASVKTRSLRFCSAEEISERLYETLSMKAKVSNFKRFFYLFFFYFQRFFFTLLYHIVTRVHTAITFFVFSECYGYSCGGWIRFTTEHEVEDVAVLLQHYGQVSLQKLFFV